MKLLLTSNGLSNQLITNALSELVGKPPSETKIAFIPTAMNVDEGDKGWFINHLATIKEQNFKDIDVVDISALPLDIWKPRLEQADVLFFGGGNTSHLMHWIVESGLKDLLPEWMKTKVWAGISAGSMVTNRMVSLSDKDKKIYYEEDFGYKNEEGLGFMDFYIRPHLNSSDFPLARKAYLESMMKEINAKIYALDDMSAIKVVDDRIEIVTEGEVLVLKN